MRIVQQAPLLLGLAVLLTSAAVLPSKALPLARPGVTPDLTLVAEGGRKGTRNYVPPDGTALPDPDETTAKSAEARAKKIADCVAIWDRGTHISKSKWREICQRQVDDSAAASAY